MWGRIHLRCCVILILEVNLIWSSCETFKDIGHERSYYNDVISPPNYLNGYCDDVLIERKYHMKNFRQDVAEECVIDMDIMLHLMELIGEALRILSGELTYIKKPKKAETSCYNETYTKPIKNKAEIPAECESLVQDMDTKLQEIIYQGTLLVELIDFDPTELCLKIAQQEEAILLLNRQLCDLETESNQTIGDLKKQILDQFQCFTTQLNEKNLEILNLKVSLDQERLRAMTSKLMAGLYVEASNDFLRMNNNSLLDPLVSGAYDPSYLEFIARFTRELPNGFQRMTVYNTLLKKMGSESHYLTSNIILFRKILSNEPERDMEGFQNVLNKVETYTDTVLSLWKKDILSSDPEKIRQIVDFGSPILDTFAGWSLDGVLPLLIKKTYDNTRGNVVFLIKFVTLLRWNIHKLTSMKTMLEHFTNVADKLQVALRIRDAMSSLNGPDGAQAQILEKLKQLKDTLPNNVKNVVWHTTCQIRNLDEKKYIRYGNIPDRSDYLDTPVYTDEASSSEGKWTIEPFLENDKYLFRIKNSQNDQYFGSQLSWFEISGKAGECSTSVAEPCFDSKMYSWEIEYEGVGSNEIRLRHVGRNGYLYGSDPAIYLLPGTPNGAIWTLECEG